MIKIISILDIDNINTLCYEFTTNRVHRCFG
jgi:hypothetical protein